MTRKLWPLFQIPYNSYRYRLDMDPGPWLPRLLAGTPPANAADKHIPSDGTEIIFRGGWGTLTHNDTHQAVACRRHEHPQGDLPIDLRLSPPATERTRYARGSRVLPANRRATIVSTQGERAPSASGVWVRTHSRAHLPVIR